MIKYLLAAFVATIAVTGSPCLLAQSPPKPQIQWMHSPEAAASLANKIQAPILVYVTAENCGYCRKMEREVWSNPQIASMVESGFVPLELNADRDPEMVASMRIRAFPTTLLFAADTQFVTGATGYLPPQQLAGLLRSGQRVPRASEETKQSN